MELDGRLKAEVEVYQALKLRGLSLEEIQWLSDQSFLAARNRPASDQPGDPTPADTPPGT